MRDKSRRSKRLEVDGPKGLKWTVKKTESGRSKKKKMDYLKKENWTVMRDESRV